jgi:DNA-binding MarR family transcriptional regulator
MSTRLSLHPHETNAPTAQLRRLRPKAARRPSSDPLAGLQMQVTYRTLRVLDITSAHPRVSNNELAERAGINDKSQTSRLLARLARLGLVENTGERQAGLKANAWTVTTRGQSILKARLVTP